MLPVFMPQRLCVESPLVLPDLPAPDSSVWQLFATEIEGSVSWENWPELSDALDALMLLQEIDEDDVDSDTLLRGPNVFSRKGAGQAWSRS